MRAALGRPVVPEVKMWNRVSVMRTFARVAARSATVGPAASRSQFRTPRASTSRREHGTPRCMVALTASCIATGLTSPIGHPPSQSVSRRPTTTSLISPSAGASPSVFVVVDVFSSVPRAKAASVSRRATTVRVCSVSKMMVAALQRITEWRSGFPGKSQHGVTRGRRATRGGDIYEHTRFRLERGDIPDQTS